MVDKHRDTIRAYLRNILTGTIRTTIEGCVVLGFVVFNIINNPTHPILWSFVLAFAATLFFVVIYNIREANNLRKILAAFDFDCQRAVVHRFPTLWEYFRFLLPKRVQDSTWAPTFWELMEDYYSVIDRIEGHKWRTRWIVFCFTLRTIVMYVQCLRAFAADATLGWLWRTFLGMFRR